MVGDRLRVEGHFSRTGVQHYSDGAGNTQAEYRSPDQVFAQTSLDSMRNMSVTVRHPVSVGGRVTPQNWRALAARGSVVGNTGESVAKADDNKHTRGTIWVFDAKAIEQVQSGELTELSVGYTAQLDETPGTDPDTGEHFDAQQTNILGNHIALLGGGEARGGPTVRILDAEGHVRFDNLPDEEDNMAIKFLVRADGRDHEIQAEDKSLASALETERKDANELLTSAEKERDTEKARADGLQAELDTAKAELEAAQTELAKPVRAQLLVDAKAVAGKDMPDEGTDHELRAAALTAAGIELDASDAKSETYVKARFDGLKTDADKLDAADKLRAGTKNHKETNRTDELSAEDLKLTTMSGR